MFKYLVAGFILLISFDGFAQTEVPSQKYGSGSNLVLDFYQKHISPIKGARLCPMYPSCSQYAKLAFHQKSPLSAYLGTLDRLLRCGHEMHENYSIKEVGGYHYYFDPVDDIITGDTIKLPDLKHYKSFGDHLFKDGDFELALLEYKRLLFDSPSSTDKDLLKLKIARCHYSLGNYDDMEHHFKAYVVEGGNNDAVWNEMFFLQAQVFHNQNLYKRSNELLQTVDQSAEKSIKILEGLNYLGMKDFNRAEESILTYATANDNSLLKKEFKNLSDQYSKLPRKNLWKAAGLSAFIPGLGYAYAKRKGTALTAFLINGLFIWVAIESWNAKRYALFTTSGLLGFGWYVGTIRGSAEAAINHNKRIKENFMKNKSNILKPEL